MIIKLAQNLSEDALVLEEYIKYLSDELESYFKDKIYATVKEFHIGIICVSKEFDAFFKPRNLLFDKEEKLLEIEIKLDFNTVSMCSTDRNQVIDSSVSKATFSVEDILGEKYKTDLSEFWNPDRRSINR